MPCLQRKYFSLNTVAENSNKLEIRIAVAHIWLFALFIVTIKLIFSLAETHIINARVIVTMPLFAEFNDPRFT